MEDLLMFLIRASVYLMIWGAGYYFFLSRNHLAFKRFFIILSFFASLLMASFNHIPINTHLISGNTFRMILPEILITTAPDNLLADSKPGNSVIDLAYNLPIFFLAFYFIRLILKLARIAGMIKMNRWEQYEQIKLIYLDDSYSPFSFFQWVFIPNKLKNSQHFDKVIRHETAHYTHGHSWDVMFLEIMRTLFWFHPVFYYLRHQLQELHEYDADKSVLQYYSRPEYQQALFDCAIGAHLLPVTNSFNVSPIKKRFAMMNIKENISLTGMIFRSALILPFLLVAFTLQAVELKTAEVASTTSGLISEGLLPQHMADTVYTEVDVLPQYPGGDMARMQFLQSNLQYPSKARAENQQGTVFISYIVEKDGKITNISILRGVSEELDEEAMRVVGLMPAWEPGYKNGQTVRVQYTLPLRFILN